MENSSKVSKTCSISNASKILGDFWSLLIVRELLKGEKRFSDIEETIEGITSSTLSSKLKRLENEGVIIREQHNTIPPKVIYSLTEKGKGMKNVIDSLEEFGNKWCSY